MGTRNHVSICPGEKRSFSGLNRRYSSIVYLIACSILSSNEGKIDPLLQIVLLFL